MSKNKFTKMHGLGNDFVVISGPAQVSKEQIAQICDRHTGVGADGFMIVTPLSESSVKMEYWNSDGSDAEMCGNGLRCVVRYAIENRMVTGTEITVETPVGLLKTAWHADVSMAEVQVGKVINGNESIELEGYEFHTANVGNPHAIAFVDDLEDVKLLETGPKVECDQYFPNKTNVEFVQNNGNDLNIIIWERGSGQTLACGTGMVASAVVANDAGIIEFPTTIQVPGGSAECWIDDKGYARLKGPAEIVFTGETDV